MTVEDDEFTSIDKLLACSEREYKKEKRIVVNSWDELGSWKNVSPMANFAILKKKNNSTKNKNVSNGFPILNKERKFPKEILNYRSAKFPYRYRFSDNRKVAHSSTNVLSYNVLSWRHIIDWKTYLYVDRFDPDEASECFHLSSVSLGTKNTNIENQYSPINHRSPINDYHIFAFSPTDVIDKKIAASYNERLKFSMDDYDEEALRKLIYLKSVIKLPGASLNESSEFKMDRGNTNLRTPQDINLKRNNITNIIKRKTEKEKSTKEKYNKKRNKKKKRHANKDYIPKCTSLPPIALPIKDSIFESFETYNKESEDPEEFSFSISQMLSTRSSSEIIKQKRLFESAKLLSAMVSPFSKESSGLYLPTLRYGNYLHLFNPKKKDAKIKLPNVHKT